MSFGFSWSTSFIWNQIKIKCLTTDILSFKETLCSHISHENYLIIKLKLLFFNLYEFICFILDCKSYKDYSCIAFDYYVPVTENTDAAFKIKADDL